MKTYKLDIGTIPNFDENRETIRAFRRLVKAIKDNCDHSPKTTGNMEALKADVIAWLQALSDRELWAASWALRMIGKPTESERPFTYNPRQDILDKIRLQPIKNMADGPTVQKRILGKLAVIQDITGRPVVTHFTRRKIIGTRAGYMPLTTENQEFIDQKTAAAILGISSSTFKKWQHTGALQTIPNLKKNRRVVLWAAEGIADLALARIKKRARSHS